MWNVTISLIIKLSIGAFGGVIECGDVIAIDRENNSTGRFKSLNNGIYNAGRSYPDKNTGDINQDALFYENYKLL